MKKQQPDVYYDPVPHTFDASAGWPYRFTYRWTHLPTEESGTRDVFTYSPRDFASLLKRWGDQQPERWKYEEVH